MSRHRSAVVAAVERLSQAASDLLSAEFLEALRVRGNNQFTLDLLAETHTVPELSGEFSDRLRLQFLRPSIADLLNIDVHVAVRVSARDAVCIVAAGPTSSRRMVVADATVRARIETRSVHLWSQSEKRIEWPCEPC